MKAQQLKALQKVAYPVLAVLLIAGGVWGYLSAKGLQTTPQTSSANAPDISKLENKVAHLEHMLRTHIQNDVQISPAEIAELNEKFNNLSKINSEILDSKANLSAVISIIERLDLLEADIKKLSAGTSNSALVLTAAAMVENAARKKQPFMYEASVLEELSRGTPMEKSAQIIAGLSIKGIPSREELIDRFIKLYEINFIEKEMPVQNTVPLNETKDWKQNIKDKFESILVIEKIGEGGELEIVKQESPIDDVYRLVRDGDFETAVLKMTANPSYQKEAFEIWIEDTRAEKIFNKQMAKIKALTLGEMKAEALK